jgi:RNA polymerase sigma-70 factor (ECF subfamily)
MNRADLSLLLPDVLPRLWSFALRLSRDPEDAEELVRQACARSLERASEPHLDTLTLHWMFSIVYSTWSNELKHGSRLQSKQGENLLETVASSTSASMRDDANLKLIDTINRLPEAQRVVILLVYAEGLRYQEAADVLGVPARTVMNHLSNVRQTIGASLDKIDPPHGAYPCTGITP